MSIDFGLFGLCKVTGFLGNAPAEGWDAHPCAAPIVDMAARLPVLIRDGLIRAEASRLGAPDLAGWLARASISEKRALFRDHAMIVQAFMWGCAQPVGVLPSCLSKPLAALAGALEVPPILNYSAYVLDNCLMPAPDERPTMETARPLRTFTDDPMEAWFLRIHIAIEAKAGDVLDAVSRSLDAASLGDAEGCAAALDQAAQQWQEIAALFARMSEGCSPEFFFHTLRHFWHGWVNNPALPGGLIYNGVARFAGVAQQFRGVAGSQSSLLKLMDILLGTRHEDNELTRYLAELDCYRPREHVAFLTWLAASPALSDLRQMQEADPMRPALDACRAAIADFRSLHADYAQAYIDAQRADRASNDPRRGTGGTAFIKHLRKMQDSSAPRL